jgi:hypothetical protein
MPRGFAVWENLSKSRRNRLAVLDAAGVHMAAFLPR